MNIIGCDVGWGEDKKRNAIVVMTDKGQVKFLKSGLSDDHLVTIISEWAKPESLILLDVPIYGCERLEKGRRSIEDALQHYISLYPASGAKDRGSKLREKVLQSIPLELKGNILIKEIYPYAVYKFLWVVWRKGKLAVIQRLQEHERILGEDFVPSISVPRYKGSKVKYDDRLTGMWKLHEFLTQYLHMEFSQSLDSPSSCSSCSSLELLADQYDACLGALVGSYYVAGNPYAWLAGDENQGEILLLADLWLKAQLEAHGINMKRLFETNSQEKFLSVPSINFS